MSRPYRCRARTGLFCVPKRLSRSMTLLPTLHFFCCPTHMAYSYAETSNDQINAPAAMREVSGRIVRSIERYEFDLGGPLYSNRQVRAVDLGDIRTTSPIPRLIRAIPSKRRARSFKLALLLVPGGDHGVRKPPGPQPACPGC
jgi:agmatinase